MNKVLDRQLVFLVFNQSYSFPDPGCLVHLKNITGGLALPFSHWMTYVKSTVSIRMRSAWGSHNSDQETND